VSAEPKDFLDRIRVDDSGCWLWKQSVTGSGYGMMPTGRGGFIAAHRYAYQRFVGPIPDGRHLHHVCEVRRCCNPEHLKPVTRREHAVEHGRGHTPDEYAAALILVREVGLSDAARTSGISPAVLSANGAIGLSPKLWTTDTVIAAIREFTDRYGCTPGAMDWNPPMARAVGRRDLSDRFYADDCWPHSNTVIAKFGRWNTAIIAAGFEPRAQGERRGVKRAPLLEMVCAGCGQTFTTSSPKRRYCVRSCYHSNGLRFARGGGIDKQVAA
jgi:hypothetical protein